MQQVTIGNNSNLFAVSELFLTQQLNNLSNQLKKEVENLRNEIEKSDPVLTEERLGEILGIGSRAIRNRLRDRHMDYIEILGKRYVRQSEFDRYLNEYLIPRKPGR